MKSKLIIIALLAFFGLSNNVFAQNPSLLWAKQMGGTGYDGGNSITIDANGNVYTTGYFQSTSDFDPGTGTYNMTSAGSYDIFISKLDASGNFLWAKQMGGTGQDMGNSIAVDANGNVYTTGDFNGTVDFDPGPGIYNLISISPNVFVLKLNASGNFLWAKQFAGDLSLGNSIAVDFNGNVYTTGSFAFTTDFDPGTGTFNLIPIGGEGINNIFVSKLDASGNFLWAKQMGGTSAAISLSIGVDANGNVYTTGDFYTTVDFDPGIGTYYLTSLGGNSSPCAFVSKLNSSGNFLWAKKFDGIGSITVGCSLDVDANGNVYTTGYFGGTVDFDPGPGTYNLTPSG